MPNTFLDSLHAWQTFYALAGGAAATLIGLMFIAASFIMNRNLRQEEISGADTFVTPALVHFICVLLIALIMLIPVITPPVMGMLFILMGVAGTIFAGGVTLRLFRFQSREPLTVLDWLTHALLPQASYLILLLASIWLLSDAIDALSGMAAASILLLVSAIRNSWDLAQWLAQHP